MNPNDATFFGRRLRELREAAGWTQAQFAEKAGLHPQAVVKLETGIHEPSWRTVISAAAALSVDVREFLKAPAIETAARPKGRPPKPESSVPKATRPRGRPRKGGGA